MCPQSKCAFCPHKIRHDTIRLKLSTLIQAMPISCNYKSLHQTIFLVSNQAPWQFIPTSAWAHVFLFSQGLATFCRHTRNNSNLANQLHNCNVLMRLLCLIFNQSAFLKTSVMNTTRIFQRLNIFLNLIMIAWGMLVSNASSTFTPKNVNFLSLMVFHLQPNHASRQRIKNKSLVQHPFVQFALPLVCANILMVTNTPRQIPILRTFYVLGISSRVP